MSIRERYSPLLVLVAKAIGLIKRRLAVYVHWKYNKYCNTITNSKSKHVAGGGMGVGHRIQIPHLIIMPFLPLNWTGCSLQYRCNKENELLVASKKGARSRNPNNERSSERRRRLEWLRTCEPSHV
jgi:hypothetical protein